MNLLVAHSIFREIDKVSNVVNSTIGVLQMNKDIVNEDIVQIIIKDSIRNDVSRFLQEKIYTNLLKIKSDLFTVEAKAYLDCTNILITYKLSDNAKEMNHNILKILIDILYNVVDEAKVEFNEIISLCSDDVDEDCVAMEVLDQLDNWNEECESYDSEPTYLEDLTIYSLPKKALYSMSLGYFDINEELFESDFVPALMGYMLEIVDDFFSVTTYEDDNIYFYISGELSSGQIDAIEDAIMETIPLASKKEQTESLEELYQEYVERKDE